MSCALHQSLPAWSFLTWRKSARRRFRTLRSSGQSNFQEAQGEQSSSNNGSAQGQQHVVLVERYGNGTTRRYVLDEELGLKSFVQQHGSGNDRFQESNPPGTKLSWLPVAIRDFILPAGFPGSVSDDYLQYMWLQFPTNITGWICHALVTSSLLQAVGIGSFNGTTAAASAAAIRWVSKDGIGALGRLFIGGRFGNLFDDDPKQWRMYADLIGSAGSIFDLTTQVYPAYFLPLASLGNLTKAVARGLKDPSFRVIQNHFAISGNLGEVSAKEEVWEVAAQLVGLGLGILILDTPGFVRSFPALSLTWTSMRLLHLWLRYQSLSVLQFDTINLKRARLLVKSHVLHSAVQGSTDCNRDENILCWETFTKPRIIFGVPLEEMVGGKRSMAKVKQLLLLYAKEKYFLVVNQQKREFEVFVSFKVGATSMSVLRSLWQTYWLHENWKSHETVFDQLAKSLQVMEVRFDDFIEQLQISRWDINQINLKVPKEIQIEELSPQHAAAVISLRCLSLTTKQTQ